MDPDPETESQNVADPTDPDPKHWLQVTLHLYHYMRRHHSMKLGVNAALIVLTMTSSYFPRH